MFNPPNLGEKRPEVGHLPAGWVCRTALGPNISQQGMQVVHLQELQTCTLSRTAEPWLLLLLLALTAGHGSSSQQTELFQGRDLLNSLPPEVSTLFPSHMPLLLPSHLCFSASPRTALLSSLQKLPQMSTAEAEFAIHSVMSDHFGAYQLHLLLKCFVSKLST